MQFDEEFERGRGRGWRRVQRARCIRERKKDRKLPVHAPSPKVRWRLVDVDGRPLSKLASTRETGVELGTRREITVQHWYDCPWKPRVDGRRLRLPPETPPCRCPVVVGFYSPLPKGKAGQAWVAIAKSLPQKRVLSFGLFAKMKILKGKYRIEKRFELLYTRRVKLGRARKQGLDRGPDEHAPEEFSVQIERVKLRGVCVRYGVRPANAR